MEIFVSSVASAPGMIHAHGITHVLSLLRGRELNELVMPRGFDQRNRLFLDMDDVISENSPHAPTVEQVKRILGWGRSLPKDAKILVHCYAGVSRSTAAALALMVQELGVDRLQEAVDWLVDHRPIACPNPVITRYADVLLGANGELHAKAEEIASSKLIKLYGFSPDFVVNRNNMKQ